MVRLIPFLIYSLPWIALLATDGQPDARLSHFEKAIRPALLSHCIKCHGEAKQEGNLRLDTREGMLQGGDSGPAIVVNRPLESRLIEAIHHRGLEMPPSGKLSEKTIQQFERWIANGAVWPEANQALQAPGQSVSDADRSWWAFQPLQQVEPPVALQDSWSITGIDRFVWAKLAEKSMDPAPVADQETLIRRLYFDLIGLPPTPDEIDAFVADTSPQGYADTIERLLDDARYGEHWARFWLDLVRYSESDGWNQDAYRPQLWRYRDYVVNAFYRDKPYPQFVLEQLAGDQIGTDNAEGLVATGLLRLGVYEYNQRDARGQWNDILNEITDVAGDVFFGLSMSCARCHDHKFDPIQQRDYYQLRAFFEPICWRDDLVLATEGEKRAHHQQLEAWKAATASIQEDLRQLLEPYEKKKWKSTVDKFPLDIQSCFYMRKEDRTSWQDQMAYLVSRQYLEEGGGPYKGMNKEDAAKHETLKKELAKFEHLKPKPLPEVMTVSDFAGIHSPTVLPNDPRRSPVPPGFLAVMSKEGDQQPISQTERRISLARWIGNPDNPLTTRVIVNRIWQQHFGRGLVSTSSDFGRLGETPSHPELLDWLTKNFINEGWSFKKLHREILLSATWRQSARHPNAVRYQRLDPDERLLWRTRVKRLQAEQIRDAMLTASGELNPNKGGASVNEDIPRRSIYLKSFRNANDSFLHGFDMANGLQSIPVRDTTTTPNQSLLLFNGKYALQRAEKLAAKLIAEQENPQQRMRSAFRWVWGRPPTASEYERASTFVRLQSGEDFQSMDENAWVDFCHVLFNSNQFLYLE